MKKLLISVLVAVILTAITAGPAAIVAEEVEEFIFFGNTYYKVPGTPFYPVPFAISSIDSEAFIRMEEMRGVKENFFHPRTLASLMVYHDPGDSEGVFSVNIQLLGDGDIILNDNVPLINLWDVWPENITPSVTLVVFDGENLFVPEITTWKELYNNSTGWPDGVTEDAFVFKGDPNRMEELRDPERNPFLDPYLAWAKAYVEIDEGGLGDKATTVDKPDYKDNTTYVNVVLYNGRKLWLVAQRQADFSYKYFFLKKYSKGSLDLSESNDLGSVEEAIAYLKGK